MLLKDEIASSWKMKKVKIISVVVGFLGELPTGFEHFEEGIRIEIRIVKV